MTTKNDPLGKRALFSTKSSRERANEERKAGAFDLTVHCEACDTTSTLSAMEFALQHFPVWAWLPWRKHSRLMRCPACGRFAWHSVSRART